MNWLQYYLHILIIISLMFNTYKFMWMNVISIENCLKNKYYFKQQEIKYSTFCFQKLEILCILYSPIRMSFQGRVIEKIKKSWHLHRIFKISETILIFCTQHSKKLDTEDVWRLYSIKSRISFLYCILNYICTSRLTEAVYTIWLTCPWTLNSGLLVVN